jgi:hypothetical protein
MVVSGIKIPGETVTVTVNGGPAQSPAIGVTVYVTIWFTFELFVSVPKMKGPFPFASPETLGFSWAVQTYVVPVGTMVVGGLFEGNTVNVCPEQIVRDWLGTTG